ncbi:hypothetical protein PPERSA_01061 [Pseudocohnilembus persalinus]|uniref:Spindle assembly abnormal protein 6 N-terminal domain-containing protein n=1 Tax=Pseudocohnilembus persalinus TaxID=266149 RepID=A0A0V0QUJ8_PSEPJ|nr:hypothetical protein PPERSA_01061 [Pseudocohnilembus persalinus]|eukprot:KRX05983.1 hypothetical protein PPERSA_01061 [Pseudocohnilembus persalinus]
MSKFLDDRGQEQASQFDFQALEEIDPSLEGGFSISYDREIPIELRLQDVNTQPQDVGTLESIRVKILIQGENLNYNVMKIELTSETDLFFNYISIIDEESFQRIKNDQKIKIEFNQFLNMVIKLFNHCHKEPHNFFSVFFMQRDGQARLDFIENMEYKFLEMLTIDFIASPEDIIRQNVTYRYNILKAKMMFVTNRLTDISALIKLKNPSLLVQLQKNNNQQNSSILNKSQMGNQQSNSRFLR